MTFVPRQLLEAWYLCAIEHAGRFGLSELPLQLAWHVDGAKNFFAAGVGSTSIICCYRGEERPGHSGTWLWNIDVAKPAAKAMSFSRLIPGISILDGETRKLLCDPGIGASSPIAKAPQAVGNFIEFLEELEWIKLPDIPSSEFCTALRQIRAAVGSGSMRLVCDHAGIRLVARSWDEGDAFEEVEVHLRDHASFEMEIELWSGTFSLELLAGIVDLRLWVAPEKKLVAVMLDGNQMLLFSAKFLVPYSSADGRPFPTTLSPSTREELFSAMHPLPMPGSSSGIPANPSISRNRLGFVRSILIEACRFASKDKVDPYVLIQAVHEGSRILITGDGRGPMLGGCFRITITHELGPVDIANLVHALRSGFSGDLKSITQVDMNDPPRIVFEIDSWHNIIEVADRIIDLASRLKNGTLNAIERVEWGTFVDSGCHVAGHWQIRPLTKSGHSGRKDRSEESTRFLKALYDHRCQICGERINLPDGSGYSEAHHVQPLHLDGPDIIENMLLLCPTHHKEMDLRILAIDPDEHQILAASPSHRMHGKAIAISPEHPLERGCLEFAVRNLGAPMAPSSEDTGN